jgi:hypothetical protein
MSVKNNIKTNRIIEENSKEKKKSPLNNDNSLSWLDTDTSITSGGV